MSCMFNWTWVGGSERSPWFRSSPAVASWSFQPVTLSLCLHSWDFLQARATQSVRKEKS